ncbi:MAG: hypothetical protein U1E31_02245 [Rickettsiales bacterium]
MLTIISSIIGFISSWIPEILQIIKIYYNNRQSVKMLNAKIELLKNNLSNNVNIENMLTSNNICYCNNNFNQNNQNFMISSDIFNLSVRPVLAYGFFILYLFVKWIQFQYVKNFLVNSNAENFLSSIDKMQFILMFLWSEQDQVFLPMIISAYFGNRIITSKNR